MWVECTGFSLRPSLLGEFNAQLRFVIYACCYACWNKFPLFRHSTLWLNFTTPLNKFVIYNIDRWYYKYWEVLHLNKTNNLFIINSQLIISNYRLFSFIHWHKPILVCCLLVSCRQPGRQPLREAKPHLIATCLIIPAEASHGATYALHVTWKNPPTTHCN